jgi:hypothetical protein
MLVLMVNRVLCQGNLLVLKAAHRLMFLRNHVLLVDLFLGESRLLGKIYLRR